LLIEDKDNQELRAIKARNLHKALSHPSDSVITQGIKFGLFPELGLKSEDFEYANKIFGKCRGCIMGKMQHAPKRSFTSVTSKVGEHLHVDIIFIKNLNGLKTPYLICVEECSGFLHLIKLNSKNKVINGLLMIILWYKSYKHQVEYIHSDSEAVFKKSENDLMKSGIHMEFSSPGDHEVFAERAVRSLKDKVRSTIYDLPFRLPYSLYSYLFMHVVMNMNDTPNSKTGTSKTPRGMIMGIMEPGRHIKSYFGMLVLAHEINRKDDMDAKSNFGIVIGRELFSTSVKVLNLDTLHVCIRNNIEEVKITNEAIAFINSIADKGPIAIIDDIFTDDKKELPLAPNLNSFENTISNDDDAMNYHENEFEKSENNIINNKNIESNKNDMTNSEDNDLNKNIMNENKENNDIDDVDSNDEVEINEDNDGFVVDKNQIVDESNSKNMSLPNKRPRKVIDYGILSGMKRRKMNQTINGLFEKENESEFVNLVLQDDPVSPSDHKIAMMKEIKQLLDMKVWHGVKFESLTSEQRSKCIPSKGFSINKRDPDGNLIKVKGRLVAGGHKQSFNVLKVSSTICKFESILLLLNIACFMNWKIQVIDIAGAYLHANLDNEVYMWLDKITTEALIEIDNSYKQYQNKNDQVLVKLDKALYGLHELSLCWYKHLVTTLKGLNYKISSYDASIGLIKDDNDKLIGFVALHVDDILSSGTPKIMNELSNGLRIQYKKIELQSGNEINYLGMKIEYKNGIIKLNQKGYLNEIININSYKSDEIFQIPYAHDIFVPENHG